MARKLAAVVFAVLFAGAAFAGTTAMYHVTITDLVAAWPSTEHFTDSAVERIVAYPAALHGRATARREIAAGHLGLKLYGLLGIPRRDLLQRLETRGVHATVVAGCVVSQPSLASWDGYNDVMRAEITRRYGDRFFEEMIEEGSSPQ